MNSRRIILAGGSGFLGRAIERRLLEQGYEPVTLTRSPRGGREVKWDGKTVGDWLSVIDGAPVVVNLAGKSVNCRYTAENRREIVDSRVNSVRAIDQAIARCAAPPEVFVQAGSAAIYGDAGDRICDENAAQGSGFSAEVCRQWEAAFKEGAQLTPRTRRVMLRITFVLGRGGGALKTLAGLTRWFLGGTVGSGGQYYSWSHLDDLTRMVVWAIENPQAKGFYNATGPNPVRNRDFMRSLRRALHRPWSPPAPGPMVRFGSWLMGTEPELALKGRRVVPARLVEEGFTFEFPDLDPALRDVLGK